LPLRAKAGAFAYDAACRWSALANIAASGLQFPGLLQPPGGLRRSPAAPDPVRALTLQPLFPQSESPPDIFLVQSVGLLVDSVRLDHRLRATMPATPENSVVPKESLDKASQIGAFPIRIKAFA
jgi:hypothetical protein